MRFKAKIDNVILLTNLLQSAEKMGKRAILKLTSETVFLICTKGEGDVQMWSQVPADNIFGDYRIESNTNNNTIALEFSITPLLQAIRSAGYRDSAETTVRLAKKGTEAALCIEAKVQTRDGKRVNITHDVHVVVRRAAEVDEMAQPRCPPLETHIELPSVDQCRPVVEHLSRIGDIIWLGATRDGRFRLGIKTTAGDIETMWKNLKNATVVRQETEEDDMEDQSIDDSDWHVVPLASKVLQKWFSSQILQNHIIAGIAPNYCVVAYVYVGDRKHGGVITYYMPSRHIAYD